MLGLHVNFCFHRISFIVLIFVHFTFQLNVVINFPRGSCFNNLINFHQNIEKAKFLQQLSSNSAPFTLENICNGKTIQNISNSYQHPTLIHSHFLTSLNSLWVQVFSTGDIFGCVCIHESLLTHRVSTVHNFAIIPESIWNHGELKSSGQFNDIDLNFCFLVYKGNGFKTSNEWCM